MDTQRPGDTNAAPLKNSTGLSSGPRRSICLVANDYDGIIRNGGIGTYFHLLAQVLAQAGWNVHVLLVCPAEDQEARRRAPELLRNLGIQLHCLEDLADPNSEEGHICRSPWFLERSDRVRHSLEVLHKKHHFDLIEFAEWQGLGMRSVQAKRSGSNFHDVGLIVRTHSSSQWVREGNLQWVKHFEDVRHDHCERYAFDHADFQLSPSHYMLEYLKSVGWTVREDAIVSAYPFPVSSRTGIADAKPRGLPELVFFGRLEVRKGLEIFLDALQQIDPKVPVTFLGKDTPLSDGMQASELIRQRTAKRVGAVQILSDFNREQAGQYIQSGHRVAVIASLADNLPFTVIECLINRVPFVASNVGGIPELVTTSECQKHLLFEPTMKDLRRCLTDYLAMTHERRQFLHAQASDVHSVEDNRLSVVDVYESMRAKIRSQECRKPTVPAHRPLVSIAVPYFNLPQYLPDTLASLADQSYENIEVIVVNDGSTDPKAIEVFETMARKYPKFRFLSHTNSGIGATRNRGLMEARGEYFIPIDADNIAHPQMVERFLAAIHHRPDVAVLTCYYKAFRETEDIALGRFPYFYRPSGGPHVIGAMANVYGDANAIFRTEILRSVGGYEIDRNTSWEDWECFVKLVHAGHHLDVLPEFLFYYRHRDESWMRVTSEWRNHRRVLRQYFDKGPIDRADGMGLWTLLVSLRRRVDELEGHCHYLDRRGQNLMSELSVAAHTAHVLRVQSEQDRSSIGYRVANKLNTTLTRVPAARPVARGMVKLVWRSLKLIKRSIVGLKNSIRPSIRISR